MASLQQAIHRDQSKRLLRALLGSARRRDRDQLRSCVTTARSERSNSNQLTYGAAIRKFRQAGAVDRPTFYQNYKSAMSSAERASEAIIHAAIEAGAPDQAIVAYVTEDFCAAVNGFMLTSFGQESEAGPKAKRRDELRMLQENTGVQAQTLNQRVRELRSRSERDQIGAFERLRQWLGGSSSR
jgi:hypothetical protein